MALDRLRIGALGGLRWAIAVIVCASVKCLPAQQSMLHEELSLALSQTEPSQSLPTQGANPATATATVSGVVADTSGAAISTAQVTLQNVELNSTRTAQVDEHGVFSFSSVADGSYVVRITAPGFAAWKIKDILVVHPAEDVVVPEVQLGVEAISTTVNAISVEDLAEQQITAEEHQRILGILPNFFVSYVADPAPLTRKQKFKLALVVSKDPVTFFTTGVTAGIEQWQGDFSGYGQGFSGYAERYGATYGDRLSSTFLGAALLPSLLHQDPRYF